MENSTITSLAGIKVGHASSKKAAAEGIQKWLVERGIATLKNAQDLPAVVGANIYDLDFSSPNRIDIRSTIVRHFQNLDSSRTVT